MANHSQSIDKSISWRPLSSPPSNPVLSEIYLDSVTSSLLQWDGMSWVGFGGASAPDVKVGLYQTAGTLTYTATQPMMWDTILYDSTGSYSLGTGIFTVPISGLYLVTGSVQWISSTVFLYVNGSAVKFLNQITPGESGGTMPLTVTIPLNVGDQIYVGSDTSQTIGGAGTSHIEICLLSTEVVVSGNPTVAQVSFSTSTSVGVNGTLVYDNVISDTDGAYDPTTGLYTVKKSGFYHCSTFNAPSGSQTNLVLCKNGTPTFLLSSGAPTFIAGSSATMSCIVGDTISIQTQAATTFNGDIPPLHQNYLCIELVPGTTIAATENKVLATLGLTVSYVVAADAPVIFDTVRKDSNPGAYSTVTGLYTCPYDGDYEINTTYISGFAPTAPQTPYFAKNGTPLVRSGVSSTYSNTGSAIISCIAGDTLGFYSQSIDTFLGGTNPYNCFMSIKKL